LGIVIGGGAVFVEVETIEVGSSFDILTLEGLTAKSPSRVAVVRVVLMYKALVGEVESSFAPELAGAGAGRKASY
jgi:hypothetical protein